MTTIQSGVGTRVHYSAEHRSGICANCGTACIATKVLIDGKEKQRPRCPQCGGQGRLIVRVVDVQAATPPACLSLRCILRYMRDSLFFALLVSYHHRRIAYATKNRNKTILDRYRTGEPSPKTVWAGIHANIKLRCPICRKYNVDPLLFGGK